MQLAVYGGIGVGLTWGFVIAQRSWCRALSLGASVVATTFVLATVAWCAGLAPLVACAVATASAALVGKVIHG